MAAVAKIAQLYVHGGSVACSRNRRIRYDVQRVSRCFLALRPVPDTEQIVDVEKIGHTGYTPADTISDLDFLRRYAHFLQSTAGFGFFETATLSGIAEPADLWVRSVSQERECKLGLPIELSPIRRLRTRQLWALAARRHILTAAVPPNHARHLSRPA